VISPSHRIVGVQLDRLDCFRSPFVEFPSKDVDDAKDRMREAVRFIELNSASYQLESIG
jgi:hypothetical protein